MNQLQTATQPEVQTITFAGTELECTIINNEPLVGFRRLCEGMGVDYSGQSKKLEGYEWARVELISTTGLDGKTYQMKMLPLKAVLLWLGTIHPNKVSAKARPVVIKYQAEVADVLFNHFFGNGNMSLNVARQIKELQDEVAILRSQTTTLLPYNVYPIGMPNLVMAPINDLSLIVKNIHSMEEIAARALVAEGKDSCYVTCLAGLVNDNNSIARKFKRENWTIDSCLNVASYMYHKYETMLVNVFYQPTAIHNVKMPVWAEEVSSMMYLAKQQTEYRKTQVKGYVSPVAKKFLILNT